MLFKAYANVSNVLARFHIPFFPAPSPLLEAFGGSAPDAPMALPTLFASFRQPAQSFVVLSSSVAITRDRYDVVKSKELRRKIVFVQNPVNSVGRHGEPPDCPSPYTSPCASP